MNSIVVLEPAATHDLRRRVLRVGTGGASLRWDGDDESTTTHLGVAGTDGALIAVSTWLRRPSPEDHRTAAVQLRGMATDPAVRGRGVGAMLLAAGLERASDAGLERAWANARVEAIGFYEHHGWVVHGPVFTTAATGLPHRLVTADTR